MIGNVLVIAGSDSGGGAGIQADIKTIAMLGAHATTAITAITSQNTQGVQGILPIPEDVIKSQIESILQDIEINIIKTGMLYSSSIVKLVAKTISFHKLSAIIDPVMISTSGNDLSDGENFVSTLNKELLPLAFLVTPNIPEAEKLSGISINSADDMKKAAEIIKKTGAKNVLLKGGHLSGDKLCDILLTDKDFHIFESARINTPNTHGTGCSLASGIAACLANGMNLIESIEKSRAFVRGALENSFKIGKGNSNPINHLWQKNSFSS